MADAMRHRKDIEGLRAVAVLPVVAYHVGLSAVPGGFVGVDVFFVISGYLITQLIVNAIQNGTFSLTWFYERRVRRIAPALLVMLAVTFLIGLHYDLPADLTDLSKSAIAATVSASNVYFWSTAGYFDGLASTKPLLHTWSLAVEEQFYLLWPLFLVGCARYRPRWLLPATGVMTVASLLLSAVGAFRFPMATFYLPFSRLWELSVGGLLALWRGPAIRTPPLRDAAAAAGLALIVGSAFLIRSSMPFPGLLALPPSLGALLIVAVGRDGQQSLVGRALSLWPVTFIGAISYSLYLWHWPITVFQKNDAFLFTGLSPGKTKMLIVVVSVAVATASYWFVEQPLRTGRLRPSPRMLMGLCGATAALVLIVTAAAWRSDGLPQRLTSSELQTLAEIQDHTNTSWRPNRCFLYNESTTWHLAPECLALSPTEPNYLLLGDSHAAELWEGMRKEFGGINFLQATAANCFPTIGHRITESRKCIQVMNWMLRDFIPQAHLDRVIIAAKWNASVIGDLLATLKVLRSEGIPVVVVGPTIIYDSSVPNLVILAMRKRDPGLLQRHIVDSGERLDAQMATVAEISGTPYISIVHLQCYRDCGWPQITDDEHVNRRGSRQIAEYIAIHYPQFGQSRTTLQAQHHITPGGGG